DWDVYPLASQPNFHHGKTQEEKQRIAQMIGTHLEGTDGKLITTGDEDDEEVHGGQGEERTDQFFHEGRPQRVFKNMSDEPGDESSDGSSPRGSWFHSSGSRTRNLSISGGTG